MAYDPESGLRYCIEQSAKRKTEEEKQQRDINLGQEQSKEKSWQEHMYVDADKPDTMDNGTATLWYIIIMIIGAVFNDRLLIWIFATVIWWRHINRKAIRQKEWNKKHNGGNRS